MSRKIAPHSRDRVIRLIRSSKRVYVGSHIRPDGDALGSLLALGLALEQCGCQVAMLLTDPIPPGYGFLPGVTRIQSKPPEWEADLGLVVDCDGLSRLGRLAPVFAGLPHLVDIDHHATDNAFGEEHLIDSSAGATAEIVYGLLRELGVQLDRDIGTCLYTAILTDTGRFCYANTTDDSLRIAAEAVEAGAEPHFIARKIFEERSIAATHLLGVALSRLTDHLDGRVVSSLLTREDFSETGAVPSDTEGIIDHLRAIGGPRVALLFVSPDHDAVRVSLRSDGSVDVSQVALGFGGGGHAMAAGCTVEGSAEEVRTSVIASLESVFAASNHERAD
ncbi:MAG: DHH family phosphoesterase [Armatimonadetes bacterium]|nr:DHH family phosphoesterase [Armatimonadota bacterium]